MPGIKTKKYRNIKRRLLDRVKDETTGALNRIDSEYVPPVSKRCRLKDCDLKDRRQREMLSFVGVVVMHLKTDIAGEHPGHYPELALTNPGAIVLPEFSNSYRGYIFMI